MRIINRHLQKFCRRLFTPSLLFIFIFLFCFQISISTAAQKSDKGTHCITRLEHGLINWTTGNILATGRASAKNKTQTSLKSVPGSARADANRHVINILKQLIISDSLTVGEYASRNDVVLAEIEKTARDAVSIQQYYTSALAVELTVQTSILGGFLQLVLPEKIKQISQINLEELEENHNRRKKNPYTGLIIDARKLKVKPVLNPVIISEKGHDIYSSTFISREFAVQNGVCRYYCNMDLALKDDRIGKNPLIIKGLRIAGEENTALVISMPDFSLLEKTTERHTFLKECRVIIVKD